MKYCFNKVHRGETIGTKNECILLAESFILKVIEEGISGGDLITTGTESGKLTSDMGYF